MAEQHEPATPEGFLERTASPPLHSNRVSVMLTDANQLRLAFGDQAIAALPTRWHTQIVLPADVADQLINMLVEVSVHQHQRAKLAAAATPGAVN